MKRRAGDNNRGKVERAGNENAITGGSARHMYSRSLTCEIRSSSSREGNSRVLKPSAEANTKDI